MFVANILLYTAAYCLFRCMVKYFPGSDVSSTSTSTIPVTKPYTSTGAAQDPSISLADRASNDDGKSHSISPQVSQSYKGPDVLADQVAKKDERRREMSNKCKKGLCQVPLALRRTYECLADEVVIKEAEKERKFYYYLIILISVLCLVYIWPLVNFYLFKMDKRVIVEVSQDSLHSSRSTPVSQDSLHSSRSTPVSQDSLHSSRSTPVSQDSLHSSRSTPVSQDSLHSSHSTPVSQDSLHSSHSTPPSNSTTRVQEINPPRYLTRYQLHLMNSSRSSSKTSPLRSCSDSCFYISAHLAKLNINHSAPSRSNSELSIPDLDVRRSRSFDSSQLNPREGHYIPRRTQSNPAISGHYQYCY